MSSEHFLSCGNATDIINELWELVNTTVGVPVAAGNGNANEDSLADKLSRILVSRIMQPVKMTRNILSTD